MWILNQLLYLIMRLEKIMLNIPQPIRNQIAQEVQSPVFKTIFLEESEDKADQELIKLARRQTQGVESLSQPWMTVAPLLMENQAISQFVAKNPDWKQALPEVLTIQEACQIAQVDYLLKGKQVNLLAESLKRPLPKSLN